jgi:hypothetical protein
MSDEEDDRAFLAGLARKSRAVQRELDHVLDLFREGSCPNPLRAERGTVRALLAAYLAEYGGPGGYTAETFMDFVACAIATEGGWDHAGGLAELYERRAREKRLMMENAERASLNGAKPRDGGGRHPSG